MRFMKGQRLALVSPWVLAAACALLSLIIGVFAVNNYQREKRLMTDVLLERGMTLIRFVTSGARASFLDGAREGLVPVWQWSENVQEILGRAAEHPGVHFLALVDSSGKIVATSASAEVDTRIDKETLEFIGSIDQKSHDQGRFRYRIGGRDNSTAFQVAALFVPIGQRPIGLQGGPPMDGSKRGGQGMMGRMMRHHLFPPEWIDELERVSQQKYIILVELDLEQFNRAVRQQLLQIVILSVVLLLVGVGGWLSLLTLEGLKGSQSRLSRIKAFRDILISSLPVGLIVTDSEGKILLCNQFAEQMASVVENEVVGAVPESVLAPALAQALDDQQIATAGPVQKEILLTDVKGEMRTLQLHSRSVVDSDGTSAGVMLLIQDLSQVKSLEEELRRSERLAALGKMAAGVAHELRNPLSSIKGLAILLKSRFQEKSSDQETADILVQEVERLNRSIGELLDYARPQKLNKDNIRPEEVVHKAVSLIRIDAESMGVMVKVLMEDNLSLLSADQDKLNQVFLNLFLNSIQAMEQGGQLDIQVMKQGRNILFTVKDTGCGVNKEDLSRIFDPYFTTKPEGTGLGLAMSMKIIEEHGGTMTFQSEPDLGTTVVVTLPCK
ncbi:MAG: PAS domain S-box protein [Proteobacteria bacterium]|jgi:two-component system sensor histidine kinase HydH|nr:PAS domain S-box protein [Desulfocapsa sp.]MBU3943401.1 PAS domain S-box protein [Pseudomonadota bacterium]MCG2744684.1 ATP-binding protein [Desulfobacteraceae bacterium]MBU4030019.1 PAS domain S-box protein [Pseudomonadota bacterium]MBU4041886.1 PAS domain S-box protein [Pseudomonadota bacterium]